MPSNVCSRWPSLGQPIFGTLILLLVFVALNLALERLTHLPTSGFFSEILFFEFLSKIGWLKGFLLIAGLAVLARLGYFLKPWSSIECGRPIRVFILILALTVAWPLATAGFNFYFNQEYMFDKLLLAVCIPLIWWRPAFVFLFTVVAYLLLWQLAEPALGGPILPHKLQVLRAINVFAAAFLVNSATGLRGADRFLILICSFVAAAYWLPALTKLSLSWISDDRLYYLPLNAYAHGWLANFSVEQVVAFARALMPFNFAMKTFVIVVETLCLFLLLRRWMSITLLIAVSVFHVGVFTLYGFWFWTWIALDIALVFLIVKTTGKDGVYLFEWPVLALSVVLIGFGGWWAKPPRLAWYDVPLVYNYRVEATDKAGEVVHVHPKFFAPYDDAFTFTMYGYLVPKRDVLTGPYGVTGSEAILESLLDARTAQDVFSLEDSGTRVRYNRESAERLEEFLRRFINNRGEHGPDSSWLKRIRAPQQFWSFRGELPVVDDITEIAIVEVTSFFDGEQIREIRRQTFMRIQVPPSASE